MKTTESKPGSMGGPFPGDLALAGTLAHDLRLISAAAHDSHRLIRQHGDTDEAAVRVAALGSLARMWAALLGDTEEMPIAGQLVRDLQLIGTSARDTHNLICQGGSEEAAARLALVANLTHHWAEFFAAAAANSPSGRG